MTELNVKTVAVIVPCRNEKKHIQRFISSLLQQDIRGLELEIIIADGMSDDGTRATLEAIARQQTAIRVIDNEAQIASTGLNKAIKFARSEVIIRMDVHAEYAPDYIRTCVSVLGETGATNVGGPASTKAEGYVQETVRLAYHSPFSAGGARFHNVDYTGPVDTVTYGCWRKASLEQLGLFDEELVRNQDDELNLRILKNGGTVWQSAAIRSWYYPRSSLGALFKQYKQYGYWKVRVIQKHGRPASIRHLVPAAFVATLGLTGAIAVFWSPIRYPLLYLISLYGALALAASLVACRTPRNWRYLPLMPLTFAAFHVGYGFGFMRGLVDFAILRTGARSGMRSLSRS